MILAFLVWMISPWSYALEVEQWQSILNFGDRDEGNAAEQALVGWLMREAQRLGIDATRYDLVDFSRNVHSFGANVGYYFPGEREEEIVILIPQSHYDGSLLLGIALAQELAKHDSLRYTMRIFFLSGEESPHWLVASAKERALSYPIGTRNLLRLGIINNQSYLLYYQLKSPTNTYTIGAEQYLRSPYSVIAMMHQLYELFDRQIYLQQSNVVPRRFIRAYAHAVDEYLNQELATVLISGEDQDVVYSLEEAVGWANRRAQESREFYHQHLSEIESEWEINYVVFGKWILREKHYLTLLVFGLFLLLIAAAISRHQLRSQWVRFRRQGKSSLVLLPMTFIALFLASFITYYVNHQRGENAFWQYMPLMFVLYKVLWTLFLSALFGRVFEGVRRQGSSKFYTFSALIFGFVSLLLFAMINIIYALGWLWFLFMYTCYVMVKPLYLRLVFLFLAPVMIIFFASDFFNHAPPAIAQLFLFDSILGNIILLFIFAPIFMLIMSHFNHRKRLRLHRLPPYISFVIYIVAIIGLYGVLRYYHPYRQSEKEPLWLVASESGFGQRRQSTARIWSIQRLGDLKLINNTNQKELALVDIPNLVVDGIPIEPSGYDFTLNVEFEEILNRTASNITLGNLEQVEYLDLYIRSDRNFGVVSANVPMDIIDQQNVVIFLGKNPPSQIEIRLISNDPFRLQVRAVASYSLLDRVTLVRHNSYLAAAYAHITRERFRTVLEI
ncbi:acyltransferase [Entomospira culicis]|uniref:Acyltransferase n=1 Tax=Entomospira culicis TaxID=2719989 RepID=A0A968GEE9_9SPIO|nr:acyltransferase [Entomospira culicis]NIZ18809.1 acyltransferase [Entomospira culicis]NIZ69024.1 acyltransferase [Entomospira culicis]WDI37614.1 acyltransferase [Entomospira culicis]WDI39242.1 acyltransferase [Entomospira culicis]